MRSETVMLDNIERKIEVVDYSSSEYPYRLRHIADPPSKLYCLGRTDILNNLGVAVVGSRKFTIYGKNVARMIGRRLSECGLSVISGLAIGIDSFAHEGALEMPYAPIAVLGSGIRRMYPSSNLSLMKRVAACGAVVSEYEPDFKGQSWSFPRRNRIISGMSEAVVLVEANSNSGALITAQYAAVQGRDIYAVPGNINSHFSAGTNQLIRDGANPLFIIDDLLNDLGVTILDIEERLPDLNEDEKEIVNVIRMYNGIRADDISLILNRKVSSVSAILTVLEIKGITVQSAGKFFLAK